MSQQTNDTLNSRDLDTYLGVYNRFPIAFERGEGCYLWDVEGKKYLDALAGIAVNSVGHSHPKVVAAIREQAGRLTHVSNFFITEPQVQLAENLIRISGLDRVFFTNSGAESLEGAFKIARKHAHSIGRGGTILSFENAFHGRTLATIAAGQKKHQEGFGPIPPGFKPVPFNDMEAVQDVASEDTAAIVVEPVQGEGGIHVAAPSFLERLREFCSQNNIVLIFDEVQCGIGRTGHWFAKDLFGIRPDILALAKGLGGGFPVGAVLVREDIGKAIQPGDHGTTFGGNPLACAAALATLEVIGEPGFLDDVLDKGNRFMELLRSLNHPAIRSVRGTGLMVGVELDQEAKPLVTDMLEQGVIANATAGNVVRFVPPLIISWDQLKEIVNAFAAALKKI